MVDAWPSVGVFKAPRRSTGIFKQGRKWSVQPPPPNKSLHPNLAGILGFFNFQTCTHGTLDQGPMAWVKRRD